MKCTKARCFARSSRFPLSSALHRWHFFMLKSTPFFSEGIGTAAGVTLVVLVLKSRHPASSLLLGISVGFVGGLNGGLKLVGVVLVGTECGDRVLGVFDGSPCGRSVSRDLISSTY